jgi:xylan 1,4-beta-xylosidase
MKKILIVLLFIHFSLISNAQYQLSSNSKGAGYFMNPIFAGDYPDPSILRDGDVYYIVHSSFEYYPGLLIWQSYDLINWTPVANALTKYVGSVWAPDLVKYKNKFYIYFPVNNTNYVVTADSMNGKWSDPIDLKIGNIDPGHVVDEKGKRYLYFSNGSYVALSDDGLSVISDLKHVYDGWKIPREWSIECFCMEGPKIVKRGEYYYLIVAEGGTAGPATSHMILAARSKSPIGPWENAPNNPIERTKSSSERWWSKGHGTLFEDKNKDWWMLFHGYENGFYNMGRQTLLLPVEWTNDGWFKIPESANVEEPIKNPRAKILKPTFTLNDDFSGNTLKPHWKFYGGYDKERFSLVDNSLVLKGKGNSIGECSPLLCVPSHHSYIAEVEMFIEGDAVGGLTLFYNNNFSSGILADNQTILANIKGWQFSTEKNVLIHHVYLKMENREHKVDMFYSLDGLKWIKIENSLEVSGMHHNSLGGFMSLRLGLCSMGKGSVKFKNFKYRSII